MLCQGWKGGPCSSHPPTPQICLCAAPCTTACRPHIDHHLLVAQPKYDKRAHQLSCTLILLQFQAGGSGALGPEQPQIHHELICRATLALYA